MKRDGEEGYALVAAVASIAVFSAMALTMLSATRTAVADATAEQAQLQASAAADAGFATALSRLLSSDLTGRWAPDSRVRTLHFGDAIIRVRMDDERGKVPVNGLTEELATRLLEEVGLDGDRLSIARDSLLDWEDDDDEARPFGAERAYYQGRDVVPPDGFISSIDELGLVRGFDPGTVQRIKLIASAYNPAGSFDPKYASPRALAVMEGVGGRAAIASIERAREAAGQRTALEFTDLSSLAGRSVTIIVEAKLPDSARAVRTTVVQLTGRSATPYVIIGAE